MTSDEGGRMNPKTRKALEHARVEVLALAEFLEEYKDTATRARTTLAEIDEALAEDEQDG